MKEYIVQVSDPSVWDTLHDEIINAGGSTYIPGRAVTCTNERPFNDYQAHYELTDAEAQLLEQDPRVKSVELQGDLRPGVIKGFRGIRPTYTYDKSSTINASMKNWGLVRASNPTNLFGGTTAVQSDFLYNLDGTGVDIVVVDTGIEKDHPEFAVNADGTGGSRVVDFDWSTLGVPGVPTASSIGGYLGDSDGHGSNCASIAAGNTCGWASGAALYSIRIFSGTGIKTGLSLGAISSDLAFDLVKAFHLWKRSNGNFRPTICTNSWGYRSGYPTMSSVTWRGNVYPITTYSTGAPYGIVNSQHPYILDYLNQSVDNASAAGVIFVGAAGNYWHKIEVPGGIDYNNNYYSTSTGNVYYHRGMSPTCANSMINIGALDNSVTEQKSYFSETGPRVDVYSPGVMIMGAYANKSYVTVAVADPRASGYYLNKISGTSQATPQVCGLLACALQARPTMTPAEAKKFVIDHSLKGNLVMTGTDAYNNTTSLQSGNNRILQMPFTNSTRGTIRSS